MFTAKLRQKMKHPSLSLITVLVIANALSACKTQRTEKWSTRDNEHQKLQKHFAGNFKLGKDEQGNGRMIKLNSDGSEDSDGSASIGAREFDGASTFKGGERNVGKKDFNTKLFAGNKQVSKDSYHFLKARENSKSNSSMQDMRFMDESSQTSDKKKSWFQRDRSVKTEGFFAKRKKNTVVTSDYAPTTKATNENRGKQMPIITPPGRQTEPITLKDVKEMLGRNY